MASGRPCADTPRVCIRTADRTCSIHPTASSSQRIHIISVGGLSACGRHSPVCAQSKQHLDGPPSSLRGHPNGGAYESSAPGLEHSVSCLAQPAVTRSLHVLRDTRAHGGHHLTLVRSSCDVAVDSREAVILHSKVRSRGLSQPLCKRRAPLSSLSSIGDMSDSIGHVSKHGPRSIACVQV